MPDISKATRPTGTVTIPCEGDEPIVLTYRRGAYSPNLLAEMADVDNLKPYERPALMARILARIIARWNLTSEKKPLPVRRETLMDFDVGLLGAMFDAITQDMNPDPTPGETSADG